MRSFDIQALSSDVIQYWSSLDAGGNIVYGQKTGTVSNMTFPIGTTPATQNRTISRSTASSIQAGEQGQVTTPELNGFSITMLIQPEISDLWIIQFTQGTDQIGVRINADTTIDLVWTTETDDMFDPQIVVETQSLIYDEDVAYLSLSRKDNLVVLVLNNEQVSINGAPYPVQGFTVGAGAGSALIDRIALSDKGIGLKANDYAKLFVQNRLDTIPRPDGESTFNYLLDAYRPDVTVLDKDSFVTDQDYKYVSVGTGHTTGRWQIIKRASFVVEYSIDLTENWIELDNSTLLDQPYSLIIFRHQNSTDEDFWIECRMTYEASIPMSYFNVALAGDVYLPADVGTGYYDADSGLVQDVDITITPVEPETKIRTIEAFGSVNVPAEFVSQAASEYTLYINGQERVLADIKPDQLCHYVIVFDAVQNSSVIKMHDLVGLGASGVPYAEWEVQAIYKTFTGAPLVSCYEEIDELGDGVSESGETASVIDLQWGN